MTAPTDQRRSFDTAIERFKAGDTHGALTGFVAITAAQPTMSDAWLGRVACGDHAIDVLEAAHRNSRSLYRETRRIGLVDGDLHARLDAPLYVTMPVWSRSTIALAYATALIADRRFAEAVDVLEDPVVTGDAMAAQWAQFVGAAAYHLAQRWPDVLKITAKSPPAHATHVVDDLTAAVDTLAAAAAASIGQFQTALDRANTVATKNQYIAADAALTRGWCLRELGQEDAARASFEQATNNGVLLDAAAEALANPGYRLIVTDSETIATRTDPWDPGTETSKAQRAAAALEEQKDTVLAQAQRKLDELIGLTGPKEQITVWRTEIQIDQILADRGEETSMTNENHMVLEGPPGTAKTSFARIAAEFLFGLGKIEHPTVVEVTEEDLVVGYISQTAARMKEVCESALGRCAFHRRGVPAGARARGPLVRQGRDQHPAEVHGGLPRPAGGDRRRLSEGDAAVHAGQPGPGVALPPDVVVHQLHARRDRADRSADRGQGEDRHRRHRMAAAARRGRPVARHPHRAGHRAGHRGQRPVRAQGHRALQARARPPALQHAAATAGPGRRRRL